MNWHALEWVKTLRRKLVPTSVCGLLFLAASQTVPACSATNGATTTTGQMSGSDKGTTGTTTTSDSCDHPNPGCACSQAGETAPCGKVISRSGDFYQCSEGTTTCSGSTWGACDGDITIDTNAGVIKGGGVGLRGFGQAMSCGMTNPCDPYCQVVADTPSGIDGGSGVYATEGGLTIEQIGATPNYCYEAATPGSMLGSLYMGSTTFTDNGSAGTSATTIHCSGGGSATDSCPFDSQCSATTGGTCSAFAQGTTNPGCSNLPDFTLGLGCWDSGSNLHGLEFEVCNRGGALAGSGTLQLDFSTTAPTTTAASRPSGCDTSLTFPDVTTTAPGGSGYCTINLAMVSLAAGECTSVNPYMPPSGITCTTSSFAPSASSEIAAVINPPTGTAFSPSSTPVAECDVCNNYTAITASSAGQAYSVCTQNLCGTPGGSTGGGSSCTTPTTVTGVVKDPGLNAGLSNIEVYVPTSTPHAFTDPVGGTTPPPCDSCSTLNDPFTLGVVTDVNGKFTLNLPNGPGASVIPYLVIQTGRWRRILQNVPITGCQANNLNPVVGGTTNYGTTSLPKCRTGNATASCNGITGDIPKLAIVTGYRESLECWLAKVGVDPSEINAYESGTGGTAGDVSRVSLYLDNGAGTVNNGVQSNVTIPEFTTGSAATSTLLSTAALPNHATVNNYSAVLFPCDGEPYAFSGWPSTVEVAAMNSYANGSSAGGRLFLDHYSGTNWIEDGPAAWNGLSTWGDNTLGSAAKGLILNSTPDQQAFYNWAAVWDYDIGNAYGTGWMQSAEPREITLVPGANMENFIEGQSSNAWNAGDTNGDYSLSNWFNTPVGAGAGNYCGRVVFNGMHVSATRSAYSSQSGQPSTGSGNGTFPGTSSTGCDATTALSSEELALEYQFFQVTACNLGTSIPIPPPSPPQPLQTVEFTRTFESTCPPGYGIKWGFFEWEGSIPPGTSINYTVQTAPNGALGEPGTFVPMMPAELVSATSASTTNYTASPSVDTTLVGAGQTSQNWLEVHMFLNPNSTGTVAPVLTNWEQLYDCIP